MKKVDFKGWIENAYGKALSTYKDKEGNPLPARLPYEASFDKLETIDELNASKFKPTDKEILAFVNAALKQNARAAATTVVLTTAGIEKPTLENDPQMQLKTVFKSIMAGNATRAVKRTEAEARALASEVTGVEWADEESE